MNKVKKFEVLYIGSFDKSDNLELFRRAISLLNLNPKKIRELIKETEWISSDKVMRDLYNSARIVVCLQYKEPFGLLPIEAMACGVPVIALNDGGYKETVSDSTGLLVKPDAKDLANALSGLLSNKQKLRKLALNSRKEAIGKWTWTVSATKLRTEIERLVNQ